MVILHCKQDKLMMYYCTVWLDIENKCS